MRIKIQLAKKGQARDCLSCVKQSELWDAYFKSNAGAVVDIEKMIGKKQIYVALDQNGKCIGFMSIIHNGCFRKFSYLSLIAVKLDFRGKGVGKELLEKFEETGFKRADRVFLLVSDFNKKAQLFYMKLGYEKVGKIPDLFKKGVSEHILVKYKNTPGGTFKPIPSEKRR
ncbi:MAG: GNAT family N-acetyltransferase, partial [Desulfobacteraceae bacterium]